MVNTNQPQRGNGFTRWVKDNYRKAYVAMPSIYLGTRLGGRVASYFLKDQSVAEMADLVAPIATGAYGISRAQKWENSALKNLATVLIGGVVGADIADTVLDTHTTSAIYDGLRNSVEGLQRALERPMGVESPRTAGLVAGMVATGAGLFARYKHNENEKKPEDKKE